ncbi:Acyl-CoA:lysophosphatidylglycerol acyltransferase 1, partial [Armadillidium nasatum]
MKVKSIWKTLQTIIRFVFVFVNNLYCIPVHVVWLFFLFPLRWVSEEWYWHIEGIFFHWLLSMVALWSYSAGYHIRELGDDISDIIDEKTVILFNHQSTSDVPLIMAAFNSRNNLHNNILWIMDRVFQKTNFGLVSWYHGDFFIRAGKEHRDASLKALANHMEGFYMKRNRKWIVLFPEGGFLKNRKATSQRFAEKNNLPHLENVSLPRVGALKIILEEVGISPEKKTLNGVKYLVDVTVAYPNGEPLDLQTIVGGWREPCETIFHYRIYPVEKLPTKEIDLTNWLYERYYEKEAMLQEYYNTGVFPTSPL